MPCRCAERGQAIRRAAGAIARGDMRSAAINSAYVGRTLAQDGRTVARELAQRRLVALSGQRRK